MSTLVLTLREPPRQPLDASPLVPEALAGRSEREIGAIPLQLGNRRLPLGELFRVRVGAPDQLVIEGATSRLDGLGRGLAGGRLRIEGDAGTRLGQDLAGGTIEVTGRAGSLAGTGMRRGSIRIAGDAGDFLAAALPGDRFGMRGGLVLVGGDAGARAGDRKRRGVVVVAGAAGAFPAARMIGGTLAVLGGAGADPGFAMRRGTLLLGRPPANLLATFQDHGRHPQPWLRLLALELEAAGWTGSLPGTDGVGLRRLSGDLAAGGRGEMLIADACGASPDGSHGKW